MPSPEPRSRLLWWTAITLWGTCAIASWMWMIRYELATHPDGNLSAPTHWPANTSLTLAEDRPTLLLFVHPQCACTKASINELQRTLTGAGLTDDQLPDLQVVASLPPDASTDWRETTTIRRAAELPHSQTIWDADGIESNRFGVTTSGAVQLYQPDGQLLFSGGVTSSRGHEGGSAGADRLYDLLSQESPAASGSTPVFGCRLCNTSPEGALP